MKIMEQELRAAKTKQENIINTRKWEKKLWERKEKRISEKNGTGKGGKKVKEEKKI